MSPHRSSGRQASIRRGLQSSTRQHHEVRADYIRSQLQEVSGDVWATWQTAKSLLYSGQRAVHDDTECAHLVNKFSDFFADKEQRIRDNIAAALQQSTDRLFATRPHTGPQLSPFQQVTVDEVRKLLTSMPCKTSPLDVLPCSLLKDCSGVFAPAIARLANLSLEPGRVQVGTSVATTKEGISNLSTVFKVLERLVQARLRPHLTNSTNFSQFQSAYR